MWSSPLPVYPVYSVQKPERRKFLPGLASSSNSDSSPPRTAKGQGAIQSFADLLQPAVDGPPSPERLRALNKQMQQASVAEKHQSQQTTSSGSSSLLSVTSDRPSWDHSPEHISVSRRSSQRSNSGSMPARERPESVQIFGKSFFNRSKGKLRKESSDQGSSNSSLHSAELALDTHTPSVTSNDQQPFLNTMLARRRTYKVENEVPNRKVKISGPYNFQHLTHTDKEEVPDLDRSHRMDLVPEFSDMRPSRPRRPTDASLKGFKADELHFSNFSSEALLVQEDPSAGLHIANKFDPRQSPRSNPGQAWQKQVSPPPVPTRSVKRAQSQEQMRFAPPRPPRSPIEHRYASPIPPPRLSSRSSMRSDGIDPSYSPALQRPATSSGFRSPKPFVSSPSLEIPESLVVSHTSPASIEQDAATGIHRFSHAITTPDETAWPLSAGIAVTPLPDVPEEEENYFMSKRSRASVASNSSSLRGSHSVPLLRQLSQSHQAAASSIQRPPSSASETLGKFDLFAAQRALRSTSEDGSVCDDLVRESWEDDIDYCYDHAAEADCDYAWERPSCDMRREEDHDDARPLGNEGIGSCLLSPSDRFDVPALSPASQISNATLNEALTPTGLITPQASNFSLPRRDSSALLLRGHVRQPSHTDNFKESQGFNLSPTLLIPNDYHQQMLLHERGELREADEDAYLAQTSPSGLEFGKSAMALQARSSASTTGSVLSEHSAATSRHQSNTSTSTAFTRWTASSTSSTIEGWQASNEDKEHSLAKFEKSIMAPLAELDESYVKRDHSREHARAQSHAELLMAKSAPDVGASGSNKTTKETLKTRRRAKTTSRSQPLTPPAFGLFPSYRI
jgi:hypothetical protein